MRQLLNRYRLLLWIGAALIAGFLATSIVSYQVSARALRENIAEQALPLTGDTIYSEIQKDILRPVFISSLMAQDTFVRDWLLGGESGEDQVIRYLNEIKQKYGVVTSFLVSEKSRKYYYAEGVLKTVREEEPRDAWYFRVRGMKPDYETNVDPDMANRDKMTVFINYRVMDYQGNFIAATGVGMTLDTMAHLIDSYRERFRRNIYFVDRQGHITLSGQSMRAERGSIREKPGLREIAEVILHGDAEPVRLEYSRDGAVVLVNARFIPELGWHLIVEQDVSNEIRALQRTLALNLAISAGITLLVLVLILATVRHYQKRLENMAATDTMTGLMNRHAFNFVFQQAVLDMSRNGGVMSVVLFDIDRFKQVNDTYGHLTGDAVLRDVAALARAAVRESDVVCRWGGEEFMILLKGCPLERARDLAEKLREAVAESEFAVGDARFHLTISAGLAQFIPGESLLELFARADAGLYQAKHGGRNRIGVAAPSAEGQGRA